MIFMFTYHARLMRLTVNLERRNPVLYYEPIEFLKTTRHLDTYVSFTAYFSRLG